MRLRLFGIALDVMTFTEAVVLRERKIRIWPPVGTMFALQSAIAAAELAQFSTGMKESA